MRDGLLEARRAARRAGGQPSSLLDPRDVGDEVAGFDLLRQRPATRRARRGRRRRSRSPAPPGRSAACRRRCRRCRRGRRPPASRAMRHQRRHHVVDVHVVAQLRAVAVDGQRAIGDREVNQPIDHAIRGAACRLARAVRIGDARDRCSAGRTGGRRARDIPRPCACEWRAGTAAPAASSSRTGSVGGVPYCRREPANTTLASRLSRAERFEQHQVAAQLMSRSVHGSSMLRTAPDCPERLKISCCPATRLRHQPRSRRSPSTTVDAAAFERDQPARRAARAIGVSTVDRARRRAISRAVRLTPMKPRPPITSTR